VGGCAELSDNASNPPSPNFSSPSPSAGKLTSSPPTCCLVVLGAMCVSLLALSSVMIQNSRLSSIQLPILIFSVSGVACLIKRLKGKPHP
jgi:hypothetical protein